MHAIMATDYTYVIHVHIHIYTHTYRYVCISLSLSLSIYMYIYREREIHRRECSNYTWSLATGQKKTETRSRAKPAHPQLCPVSSCAYCFMVLLALFQASSPLVVLDIAAKYLMHEYYTMNTACPLDVAMVGSIGNDILTASHRRQLCSWLCSSKKRV